MTLDIPTEAAKHATSLELRVSQLEKNVEALHSLLSVEKGRTAPMDLGTVFFPPGDPVPSKSPTDLLDGMVFSFKTGQKGWQFPFVFKKNTSGKTLNAGDKFDDCIVDKTLRCPCEPNNFFWLEV